MKKNLALVLLFCANIFIAQEKASDFTGRNNDQKRDPRMDQMSYVPNEILLKFKDEVAVKQGSRVKAAGVNTVDQVLQTYGVASLEKLFPDAQKPARARMMKSPQGKDMKIPRIDNIYRIVLPEGAKKSLPMNIHQVIEELKALPEIEYAEPNYIYSIGQLQPIGPELTADEVARMQNNRQKAGGNAVVPNDPLYSQQWHIPAVKADLVWEQTTGDTTQVIAILDTGVDWTHPDLKNKIWRNWGEIPGNGIDDDGNGYIDDYMGWDFINNDNNPMDDNSHGTHVAGIAAAEANNGIGIAGVNWGAKIMSIKVFQSSGRGDAATITRGIIYASQKGATVINMSFGSYARSMAMQDALANAYTTTILIAAAGNDKIDIEDRIPFSGCFYPAALSFVLGVMAPDADFTNTDKNGPIFSLYAELNNYELTAPGTSIISTVNNGNYKYYQGTSMATPIISGAVSIYKKIYPHNTNEILWGDLINTAEKYINIYDVISIKRNPVLNIVKYEIADTTLNGDWDWKADAGETILLNITVRNTWEQADSVFVGIRFQEFEDTTTAEILSSIVNLGTIGTYATLNNYKNQLKLRINSDIAHDRDIGFKLETWSGTGKKFLSQQDITIRIENGTELKGILEDTLRLTPDKFWLVSNSFKMSSTGLVIIEPGTKLRIEKRLSDCKFRSNGTRENPVVIDCYSGAFSGGYGEFTNTIFKFNSVIREEVFRNFTGVFKKCVFDDLIYGPFMVASNFDFEDCIFENINNVWMFGFIQSQKIRRCNFNNLNFDDGMFYSLMNGDFIENNIANCYSRLFIHTPDLGNVNIYNNNFLGNGLVYSTEGFKSNIPNNYWGTLDSMKIENKLYHFWDYSPLALLNYKPQLSKPSKNAHGCVWKIMVNGKDAQDEFHNLDPLSVGKHKFEIYFNRAMDTIHSPLVSMGVREPYNQTNINENGRWSMDSLIFTVYKNLALYQSNGLNRIKIVGGFDSEGFELVSESERFNVNIQTTTSASTEFMATPGLGKVALEWNHNDLEDGLGYNMYRMEHINDSTLTQPVIVNNSLITDTLYTDYSVVPNKKYYYYYKILRTNMAETDSSRVVSAIPFTASKGDANGDLSVNVLDITTIVAHLLNNNPQPFIREAADVNNDTQINVLDIVGVVNLVLNVPQNAMGISMSNQVDLYLQNDTLFANSNVDIGAIQLDMAGVEQFNELEVLNALKPFESGNSFANGNLRVIFYSMSGKSIEPGQAIPLLKMKPGSMINDVIIGEPNGSSVKVNYIKTRIPDISANMNQTIAELGQNYPNPVNGLTTIPVRLYEPVDELVLRISNMMGQELEVIRISNLVMGENLIQWNPAQHKGMMLYKLEIRQGVHRSFCPAKRMMVH